MDGSCGGQEGVFGAGDKILRGSGFAEGGKKDGGIFREWMKQHELCLRGGRIVV